MVRAIWGSSDTILFIFAGAAAEFALNKAVDWLYFTGKLPADPIGRLFSTVEYARKIVFSPKEEAERAIATMAKIHAGVEGKRGYAIPEEAYRDVLFMLIYYSIAAFELLNRPLTAPEKVEVYDVFYRVGKGMGVKNLPENYYAWLPVRYRHLSDNLERSALSDDLFVQYKKHLGAARFNVLLEAQKLVVPKIVARHLGFGSFRLLKPAVPAYKISKQLGFDGLVRTLLLPPLYKEKIDALDMVKN